MPRALNVRPSNQRLNAVQRQSTHVSVGKDSMAPAAIVPSADMAIGARAVSNGHLALWVHLKMSTLATYFVVALSR